MRESLGHEVDKNLMKAPLGKVNVNLTDCCRLVVDSKLRERSDFSAVFSLNQNVFFFLESSS